MIDNIRSFGDSFIFGCDLNDCNDSDLWKEWGKNYSQLTWPALISKQLELTYHSSAMGGVGNQFIAEHVIASSELADAQNMLFVINWTWIDRFDYFRNNDFSLQQHIRPGDDSEISKFYYKNLHSDINDKFRNLCWIATAHQCLKDRGIKFISTIMDKLLLEAPAEDLPHIPSLQNKISKDISWFQNNQTFLEWSRANNYPESQGWHPLEQAHEEAAKYWQPIYEKAINTHIT
jgi:hypothetical protein